MHAHGLCQLHENRRVRHGDPLYEAEPRGTLFCSIPDCGGEHLAGGYCRSHYTQQRRHGDPLHAQKVTAEFLKRKAHPLHSQWQTMVSRCTNPRVAGYERYGGRGITVCDSWRENFWAYVVDVGLRVRDTDQLDRIDNDGPYEPGNVAWVSPAENSQKRSSNVLTAEGAAEIRRRRSAGETQEAIAQALGVTPSTVLDVISGRTWNNGDAPDMRIRRRRPRSASAPEAVAGSGRRDPLYDTCAGIKARCLNPRSSNYAAYGGRGIRLHEPWAQSPPAFLEGLKAEIGPRPSPNHSIDRIDNDGHYEPGNLRWATSSEQLLNRRPRPPKA
ncbi:hypothetical protein JMJ55_26215 [Belnapia sp. T6]|uniref:Uncharacterized protein n=1 Tax=Belnapia mucosa TaxID=2804532 RepID=A0ABS1VAX4_9PROT|nr:hypothetical protein [Belnapia mucosa]MBL6458831.1 hypothetical protein [Belnapia mucosa]